MSQKAYLPDPQSRAQYDTAYKNQIIGGVIQRKLISKVVGLLVCFCFNNLPLSTPSLPPLLLFLFQLDLLSPSLPLSLPPSLPLSLSLSLLLFLILKLGNFRWGEVRADILGSSFTGFIIPDYSNALLPLLLFSREKETDTHNQSRFCNQVWSCCKCPCWLWANIHSSFTSMHP